MTPEYFASVGPWLAAYTVLLGIVLFAMAAWFVVDIGVPSLRDGLTWLREALRPEPPVAGYGSEEFDYVEPRRAK